MTDATAPREERPSVEWRSVSAAAVAPPINRSIPYFEAKLEHPVLDPTGHGDQFFPDAVPYELAGTERVFYWRGTLDDSAPPPDTWSLACATPWELVGYDALPSASPSLVCEEATGTGLLVDGTIAGEVAMTPVADYAEPAITIRDVSAAALELTVEGSEYRIASGNRRRIPLAEQRVEVLTDTGGARTAGPELVVRFPGRPHLVHPAPDASYRLFPSFGLDLAEVPNPLSVPTAAGELDHATLAADLDLPLSQRPYPERVLWQAFAFSAFDPHSEGRPALTQLSNGYIALLDAGDRT